jgi:hypothetical protein
MGAADARANFGVAAEWSMIIDGNGIVKYKAFGVNTPVIQEKIDEQLAILPVRVWSWGHIKTIYK